MGKRSSEPKPGSPGREVLWLAPSDPPAQLLTFLRSRGFSLVARDERETPAPLKLLMIEASGSPVAARAPNLAGRRVAVMHPDPGNADALAQSLRAKGAEVVALSLNPESLQRAETLDPDAVIMEASDFCSSCWEIVRALWQHPHLRFATVILATPELMGSQQITAFDVHDLSFAIDEVAKEYERIADDARRLESFSFELSSLGPSRSLRALLAAGRRMRLSITAPEASIEVDLAEQIIVGAQSPIGAPPSEGLLGVHALNLLLTQRSGHVEVRSVDHPAHTNVMAPLDTALHMAREASSGVRPSAMQRPLVANHVPTRIEAPASSEATTTAAAKTKPSRQQTLIGVPVVQIDAHLLATKTKPGRPSGPPASKPQPSAPARSLKPPAPPSLPEAPTLPPARAKPALPPAIEAITAPTRPPATNPYAATMMNAMAPPPPPSVVPAEAAPAALAPETPISIAPAFDVPTAASGSLRPAKKASALDTVRMDALDAEAVRAFRSRGASRLPKIARWLALALPVFLAAFWLVSRGKSAPPGSASLVPTTQLVVPHARAAEPPAPVTPVPAAAAPEPVAIADEEPAEPADVSPQHRGNARKANLLSNQGNAFRRKKMLPSARVRYLEALKAYPGFPRALSALVQLGLSGGDTSEALRYAKQLVKARPGQAPYQLLLGDAYRATGEEQAARASYQSAARLGNQAAEERLAK